MAYLHSMAALLLRLLAAFALIAMPLGMASAGSLAQSSAPTVESSHCADHAPPSHAPVRQDGHCAACVVLTNNGGTVEAVALRPKTPMSTSPAYVLAGHEPEVATPPPKMA